MTAPVTDAELAALLASLGQPTTPIAPVPLAVAATDDAIAADASAPWQLGEREALIAAAAAPAGPPARAAQPCDDPFCGGPGGGCGWLPVDHPDRDRMAGGRGLIAAPAAVAVPAGPPPSTVKELRAVLIDFEASRPRTMQVALGPSELGTPCEEQIARKLVGAPRQPITAPTWAPFQGTAVHRSMEDVVEFWNRQLGRERWLAEDRLYIDPGLPGVDPIEGNGDAFDTDYGMVVDWKHTGKTARDKLRRAKRMGKHPAEQVSAEYRVQGHLYGLGHEKKGRPVRYVRLVLLARDFDYDESEEWTEEYNPDIAHLAIARYYAIHDAIAALGGTQCGDLITAIPSAPSQDTCKWCPFFTPGRPSSWAGCAGNRPPDKHVALATAGLIEAPTDSGAAVAPANQGVSPFTKENETK